MQMYTYETLPVITIGPSTFFPVAGSGHLGKLLLLNRCLVRIWMESFMFQVWQGSSMRVSHDCQNAPSTRTSSTLPEDLLVLRRRPMGHQKSGQKESISAD